MRIKVIQKPSQSCIDGIQIDRFRPGLQYEVGHLIGALFLAEGWAVPAVFDEPAVLIPMSDNEAAHAAKGGWPPNLSRGIYPPYYDFSPALGVDRRRKPRVLSRVWRRV